MSYGKYVNIKIEKGDMVIFLLNFIFGNRMVVEFFINCLVKLGVIIKENGLDGYLYILGYVYKYEYDKIF